MSKAVRLRLKKGQFSRLLLLPSVGHRHKSHFLCDLRCPTTCLCGWRWKFLVPFARELCENYATKFCLTEEVSHWKFLECFASVALAILIAELDISLIPFAQK